MILEKINTKYGEYQFAPVHLYHGRKKINKNLALKNLFDVADILDENGVRFGLIYGTLLGVFRDGDFIDWDEDVDLFVFDEDREKLLTLLFHLKEKDLLVVRYNGQLLSLMRSNECIDLYFFRQGKFGKRRCGSHVLDSRYFLRLETLQFKGRIFSCPAHVESFLVHVYGDNWRTPLANKPADARGGIAKLKDFFKRYMPESLLGYLRMLRSVFSLD